MTARRIKAFTLLELMVVITIIVLLMLILLPSFSAAHSVARSAKCAANLHGFSQAIATRNAQQALTVISNSCSMMDLPPYLSDYRIFICPEDNPLPEIDAKLSAYKSGTHNTTNFLYDMQFGYVDTSSASYYADPWVYRTNLSPGNPQTGFLLNFEDERPAFGDKSFYNNYIKATWMSLTTYQLTSLGTAPAGDIKPPISSVGGGPGQSVFGGYSFDLVTLSNGAIVGGSNFTHATGATPTVNYTPFGISYGMNTLYPAQISPSGGAIIVFDFQRSGANMAGSGSETATQWAADLAGTKIPYRSGFARHRGKLNALMIDNSVRTQLVPSAIDPTNVVTGAQNKKTWWGGP